MKKGRTKELKNKRTEEQKNLKTEKLYNESSELLQKSEEIEKLKTQLVRTLADYDNLKKRVEAEKEIWFKVASVRIIGKFLSVLDDLEGAQKHLNDQGLAIIIGEFRRVVEEEGFEEISLEIGKTEFNHDIMEVVETVPGDDKNLENKVAEVVLPGWKAKNDDNNGMVVRTAKVKVYQKLDTK